MNKIPNSQLLKNDIPLSRASWKNIQPFALSFNGYKHWGSFQKCREVADLGRDIYRKEASLAQSLTDLRTCLFFEARRWKHFGKQPGKKSMEYIRALVEGIRLQVEAKEIG